jgi:glycogen synthase
MRILLATYAFYPSVGGLEEVNALLADAFAERGHAVKILTMTPAEHPDASAYEIIRQPKPGELIRALSWCDVFLQANVGFRLGWPNFLLRRPWVIALHGNLDTEEGRDGVFGWKSWVKRLSLRSAAGVVAVSEAVARRTFPRARVIGNPYRKALFRALRNEERRYDLVFLGRLVSDKGLDLLIDALPLLQTIDLRPSLLVIGGGPEEAALRERCRAHGVEAQVTFAGIQQGEALVSLLNCSAIMVIPSIWEEPFGIVALEGIACGCSVVAAASGGLPEAVGPCGIIFPKGDRNALAAALATLLRDEGKILQLRAHADAHLARYDPYVVAEKYLEILGEVCRAERS